MPLCFFEYFMKVFMFEKIKLTNESVLTSLFVVLGMKFALIKNIK